MFGDGCSLFSIFWEFVSRSFRLLFGIRIQIAMFGVLFALEPSPFVRFGSIKLRAICACRHRTLFQCTKNVRRAFECDCLHFQFGFVQRCCLAARLIYSYESDLWAKHMRSGECICGACKRLDKEEMRKTVFGCVKRSNIIWQQWYARKYTIEHEAYIVQYTA